MARPHTRIPPKITLSSLILAVVGAGTFGCSKGKVSKEDPYEYKKVDGDQTSKYDTYQTWPGDSRDQPRDSGSSNPDTETGADAEQDTSMTERDTGNPPGDTGLNYPDVSYSPNWQIDQKVLVLNFDPIIDSSGKRAHDHFSWHDPHKLAKQYKLDMYHASKGSVRYKISKWEDIDGYPKKADGFRYTDASWKDCINNGNCHMPDKVDYTKIVNDHKLCQKVKSGTYDEIWMFGGPYFGYWESTMAGDDAFFLNSEPVPNISCERDFVIMGFNYERPVANMLHDFGHRTEFTMKRVYQNWSKSGDHPFAEFSRHESSDPGKARCGNTHFPPNAAKDYDYANSRSVQTSCDNYKNFPNVGSGVRQVSCSEWNCNQRDYMKWWISHLPRNAGTADGYENNWWKYLIDFNQYIFNGNNTQQKHCGAYTSLNACDKHPKRCAWFICGNVCLEEGTKVKPVCDCTKNKTLTDCNNSSSSCAWYACVNRCLPKGTDIKVVCGN